MSRVASKAGVFAAAAGPGSPTKARVGGKSMAGEYSPGGSNNREEGEDKRFLRRIIPVGYGHDGGGWVGYDGVCVWGGG